MRITTTILAACLCVALVHSVPINSGFQSQALDRLMVDETVNDEALRSKRTIGILRQLFPEVSKMIEDKLNRIVGEIVKIFGPVVFSSILGNNNKNNAAGGSSKSSGSTVNAEPPFDDDDDDVKSFVDDDDWFNAPAQNDNAGSKISLDLPTLAPKASSTSTSTTTTEAPLLDIGSESSTKPEEANAINVDEVTTPIDETATNSVL